MEKKEMTWAQLGIVLLITAIAGFVVTVLADTLRAVEERGYEQGQIDALNGKWKYEVVVKPDTTYIIKPE